MSVAPARSNVVARVHPRPGTRGALHACAVFASLAIILAAMAQAAETPKPPAPTTWVTDNAGVLSSETRAGLESRLAEYNRRTGHQVIVWIGNTTGNAPLEDWTIRAFTAWKVGRKGLNDGAALFIFMQDRKVRIEVGYGLEPVLTDAVASGIARNEIAARMKTGDVDGAVTAGVSALLAAIGGEQGAAASQSPSPINSNTPLADLWMFAFALVPIILLIVIIYRVRRAMATMYPIGSRRRSSAPFFGGLFAGWSSGVFDGGSSGGDFGGFSGGGGMGGGGGASASW